MKRKSISLFLAIIILLSFVSCKEESIFVKDFFPERAFSVHMKATKEEKNFEADIICRTYDDIEIAFTYPKEFSGFTVTANGDKYTVNVFGVPDELTKDEIKDSSLLNVLIQTLRISVFTNHGMFTETEDCYTADLTVDGTPVHTTFSKDGYIRSITAESIAFSAEFT